MDNPESEQLLGELKGSTSSIQVTVNRILDGQEVARKELQEMDQRNAARLREHAAEDGVNFGRIIDRIEGLQTRVGRMEGISDAVESHSDALLSVEHRLDLIESTDKTREAIRTNVEKNNVRWQRGIAGAATVVGAAAGSAGTTAGPKIWKIVMAILGGAGKA